ncbi:MAG: branched-chain amino acid ABC transporter permease [Tomitella sp.]|nr:branched-chain amino acid ABC transporter permease [Tomitella sp.]
MTQFLQLMFEGVSQGAVFALIALGFSVIFRASRVLNFAQGAMILVSAYLISVLAVDAGLPFVLAVVLTIVVVAAGAVAFHRTILRRIYTRDVFAVVMITLGASIVLVAGVDAFFGGEPRILGDPWGPSSIVLGGVTFTWVKIWGLAAALVVVAAFFAFDRFTRAGIAMRATAEQEEAALAAGVPVGRIHAIAWAVAGLLAVLGGLFLAGFPSNVNPTLGNTALIAFPAIVLGGLDSPVGALVGGLIIGLVQVLTAGYIPSALGSNFGIVAPYIVMIGVLLVKPYGLFGSRPAERI